MASSPSVFLLSVRDRDDWRLKRILSPTLLGADMQYRL